MQYCTLSREAFITHYMIMNERYIVAIDDRVTAAVRSAILESERPDFLDGINDVKLREQSRLIYNHVWERN